MCTHIHRTPEPFNPYNYIVKYTHGVEVGPQRFCLEPPATRAALLLCVYILATADVLRAHLGTEEGREGIKHLVGRMKEAWMGANNYLVQVANDLGQALNGTQNAVYLRAQALVKNVVTHKRGGGKRTLPNTTCTEAVLLMWLLQVSRYVYLNLYFKMYCHADPPNTNKIHNSGASPRRRPSPWRRWRPARRATSAGQKPTTRPSTAMAISSTFTPPLSAPWTS